MVSLILLVVGFVSLMCFSPMVTAFTYSDPVSLKWFLRIFSHMVSHGSIYHLLGNFLFGLPFMLYAEYRIKNWKTYLKLFFYCGLAALIGEWTLELFTPVKSTGVIGSSGAIFGIVAFALAIANETKPIRWLSFSALTFYLYTQAEMSYYMLKGEAFGIAYGAHFAGMFAGMVAAVILRRRLHPRKDLPNQSRSQKRPRDARGK